MSLIIDALNRQGIVLADTVGIPPSYPSTNAPNIEVPCKRTLCLEVPGHTSLAPQLNINNNHNSLLSIATPLSPVVGKSRRARTSMSSSAQPALN